MSLAHIFQYCLILLMLSPISVKEVIKHEIQANSQCLLNQTRVFWVLRELNFKFFVNINQSS